MECKAFIFSSFAFIISRKRLFEAFTSPRSGLQPIPHGPDHDLPRGGSRDELRGGADAPKCELGSDEPER